MRYLHTLEIKVSTFLQNDENHLIKVVKEVLGPFCEDVKVLKINEESKDEPSSNR